MWSSLLKVKVPALETLVSGWYSIFSSSSSRRNADERSGAFIVDQILWVDKGSGVCGEGCAYSGEEGQTVGFRSNLSLAVL